ncbi:hypothetical protein [Hymenobacter latericus]|uniref:hypothetical protein n=1 Tax=Hymenobacter sp. YIM 151858-1 TaxID=2987688 RepID=UPI0022268499|nr:hypothetical protein [Hymenobacter sp. YIM 151858-1]UYZ60142.1 hypothetical protein OIS50_04905 [Hymenobacter sp. YIM 151858-1]
MSQFNQIQAYIEGYSERDGFRQQHPNKAVDILLGLQSEVDKLRRQKRDYAVRLLVQGCYFDFSRQNEYGIYYKPL